VWRVSPQALAAAALRLDLFALVPMTALLVLALYFWEAICLKFLFAAADKNIGLWAMLKARGTSYLAGVLNYELGQGVLALLVARAERISFTSALSRCVLLAYHDASVLLGLGLVASLMSADARAGAIRAFCAIGLVVVLGAGVLASRLPPRWRNRLQRTRWGLWLDSWSWARSLQLCGLRAAYFGIILAYAAAGIEVCGIRLGWSVLFSAVAMALLADGLPISVSGLGTREATLLYLIRPDQPEVLLAFSLVWSAGLLLGRITIGLGNLWLWASLKPQEVPA
jgi:hypothetical protein